MSSVCGLPKIVIVCIFEGWERNDNPANPASISLCRIRPGENNLDAKTYLLDSNPPRNTTRHIMTTTHRTGKISLLASKGFTLTEVLVVITIIVVLAALSVLGVSKVRSAARGATCVSNLRQIGTAMLSYAADKNGELPPIEDRRSGGDNSLKGWWTTILADGGYLGRAPNSKGKMTCGAGVWACPECTTDNNVFNGYGGAEGTVMKVWKSDNKSQRSLRLSEIPKPEMTWLVGDALSTSSDLKSGWYAIWANPASWGGHSPGPRHGGKVNVCMADGHIESLTMKELRAKDYTNFK
jgi:prepilin-type N-terminal cleavage/methylation domain-containing protein/prepilin-type processing-associated H-X9-DG protein